MGTVINSSLNADILKKHKTGFPEWNEKSLDWLLQTFWGPFWDGT